MFSKVSDKMAYANNVDPDQTAPFRSTLFAISLSILRTAYKQKFGQKSMK